MVKNIKNEVNSSKENQQFTISTASTKDNTKKGETTMDIKQYTSYEVNLLRTNNKLIRNQMNIFAHKTKEGKQREIFKLMIKRILRKSYILFTENQFGIYINMSNIQYRIVFLENQLTFKIYVGDLEVGNSYLQVNDQFDALLNTMFQIKLYFYLELPFNAYADNNGVA